MSMNEPLYGTFHDANTGDTVTRELTQEEIDALLEANPSSPDA